MQFFKHLMSLIIDLFRRRTEMPCPLKKSKKSKKSKKKSSGGKKKK
jgi:hypothetical protein